MTDNLARRFVFETAASPRSLISCRSETVRALEPRRSKDNISHTGRQYNRHATFSPGYTCARVYVISCTCTPSRLRACTWRRAYFIRYIWVLRPCCCTFYTRARLMCARARARKSVTASRCAAHFGPVHSSSRRRPLSHRAETRPLRFWVRRRMKSGTRPEWNRARESLPRWTCDPRHGRFPVFPLLRAETHNEKKDGN